MTAIGWAQIVLMFAAVLALTKPLGLYMARVFESDTPPLARVFGPIERGIYRLSGIDANPREQTWVEYAIAMLLFSVVSLLVTYAILRLQHVLPLNPQKLGPVEPALAFNTAASCPRPASSNRAFWIAAYGWIAGGSVASRLVPFCNADRIASRILSCSIWPSVPEKSREDPLYP